MQSSQSVERRASLPYTSPHTWTALKSQVWLEPYIRVKLRTGADKTFLAVSWLTASDLAQLSESLAWTCQEAELSGSWKGQEEPGGW